VRHSMSRTGRQRTLASSECVRTSDRKGTEENPTPLEVSKEVTGIRRALW